LIHFCRGGGDLQKTKRLIGHKAQKDENLKERENLPRKKELLEKGGKTHPGGGGEKKKTRKKTESYQRLGRGLHQRLRKGNRGD